MNYDFGKQIEAFQIKTDKEILEYLFGFWKLDGQPEEDGSFKVVASYQYKGKDKNGFDYGFFVDVRSLNGDILYYPFRLGKIKIYTPHKDSYTKEKLWLINVKLSEKLEYRLNNPFLLQLADRIMGKPKNTFSDRLENEKLIKRIFEETGATKRDAKNTANALLSIMGDLYSESDERFIFELLQNADDQPQDNQHLVNVKLKALEDHLLFIHTGKPFSKEDVESISSIGDSTKKNDTQKTGYKGIGFKSVFSGADTVFIDSGSFSFAFDKDSPLYKSEENMDEVPWQLKPIWEERYRLPKEVALDSDYLSYPVGIAIQAGSDRIQTYKTKIKELFAEPRFMLFLRHIGRIDFSDIAGSCDIDIKKAIISEGVVTINSNDNTTMWIVSDYDISIPPEIHQLIQNEKLVPDKLKDAQKTRISFATQINNGAITSISDSPLFCYLPTKVKEYAFPFLVNADFLTTASRESIHHKTWNQFLFQQIGKLTIQWAIDMSDHVGYLSVLPIKLLPESNPLSIHFNVAFKSAIENEAFILNHRGNISKQDEIILDTQGLSQLIGPDLFCKIMKTDKCLPSMNFDSKILEKEIFEKIEKPDLEDTLEAVTDNPDFNAWFIHAEDEQKETFFRWINWIKEKGYEPKEGCLENLVLHLPLFKFGEQFKTRKEIDPNSYVICTEHIMPIKDVLLKIGIICSDNYFDESCTIYGFIEPQNEVKVFESIAARIVKQNGALLDPSDRLQLFLAMESFVGVGPEKLSKILFFHHSEGQLACLYEMFAYNELTPLWARPFMIAKEECFDEIKDLLQNEFDIIWKNIDTITTEQGASITDVYNAYKWTDDKYTIALIDEYKKDNNLVSLLPIVEDAHTETKQYYLDSIQRIELLSGSSYKKDSYEYRVLQMALSTMTDPSVFSSKVYFDGTCIKDYSVKDEVECSFNQEGKEKKVVMSLARLLPKYQNQSDKSDSIKILFNGEKWIDKFFDAKPKPISEVYSELNSVLGIVHATYYPWKTGNGNAIQYLFSVYRRKQSWSVVKGLQIDLRSESDAFISEMMDFLYDNDLKIETSPFTFHLRNYFKGKSFDSQFVFDEEKILKTIEQWADDDKKKMYLSRNGVKNEEDPTILFRKLFIQNKQIDFINSLSDSDLASEVAFIASAGGIDRPFEGENQRAILLELLNKKSCKLESKVDLEELQKSSTEWDNADYNTWTQNHYPRIFIYPGHLPEKVYFGSVLLVNYPNDKQFYYYDKQRDLRNESLFISDTKKIDDVLFEIAKEGKTSFLLDDYKVLFLDGKVAVSKEEIVAKDKAIESLSESNRKKDEIIKLYRDKYGVLEDTIGLDSEKIGETEVAINTINEIHHNAQDEIKLQMGKVIERDGISEEEKIAAHKEADQIIREKLEEEGYDCSKWVLDAEDNDDGFKKWHSVNQIDGIINPNGETINLVVKSAKGGYIYLSATDFEYLTSNRNNILMVWDGKSVHSVTAEDIFNKDSNVNLIFDTDYTPKHYYAALSKVFQYVKRTTFAVKNPSYNAYDSVTKTFGMDSTTEGIQPLFDDNDL